MSFQSLIFMVFLFFLIVILALVRKEKVRQYLLIAMSLVFYGLWDWRFLFFVLACVAVVYWGSQVLNRSEKTVQRKTVLTICLIVLLGILAVFKYLNFFISGFCNLFGISPSISLQLLLPVGISFYIFSSIGFIIDVYRGEIEGRVPLYKVALYVLFFPKILQGPLHKAKDFLDQLNQDHPISWNNLSAGVQVFLFGFIKKVVIADRLGLFVDTVYSTPRAYSGLTLLLVALSYPIQLYCDFSGYTDMALGTAKMMGYELCPNFNLPFLSKTVAEYWRRWHMSLNIWFRDYLFYPIIRSEWVNNLRKKAKGNSKKLAKIIPPVMGMAIVWPLVGLWHGASWNFILYGACYGLLMIAGQIHETYRRGNANTGLVFDIFRIIRTLVITIVLLILFRMPDLNGFGLVVSRIITMKPGIRYYYTWSLVFIPLVMGVSIIAYKKNNGNSFYVNLNLAKFWNKVIFCTVGLLTIVFMYVGENYFMYFQF